MEIMDELTQHKSWTEFMGYRISKGNMRKADIEDLRKFVNEREYEKTVSLLKNGGELSTPHIIEINKSGVNKKRSVFTFTREENYVLKMITYLLKKYDHLFSDNLYSFRSDTGVKKALHTILKNVDLANCCSYKTDIHDYFNSIDTETVLEMVKNALPEEKWLIGFLSRMLRDPFAIRDGERITVRKGAMAGTPTAGFLADLYLAEMDAFFSEEDAVYARYSDDIIVFSDSREKTDRYEKTIKEFLNKRRLEINPKKEVRTAPGDKIEFLGFELSAQEINISAMGEKKIKAKMKRKARALYRWKIKKNAPDAVTAKAYTKFLNSIFYDNPIRGEITWCRWYFPLITSDSRLKRIDEYAVSCIRYLYTGGYGKKNYDLRYSEIKELGFSSLVNNYWRFRNGTYSR